MTAGPKSRNARIRLSVSRTDTRLAQAATGAGIGPWIEVNRILIQRAIDRGEFPAPSDLNSLAELIPMMCVSRAVQQQPITRQFSLALVDGVIIPALRGGAPLKTRSRTGLSINGLASRPDDPPGQTPRDTPLRPAGDPAG